jgi:hypothetical protein
MDMVKMTDSPPLLGRIDHPSKTAVASICLGKNDEMEHWMRDI